MARKKVTLAWIANDSARRATFKKRKNGLMKKVSELSTLCGVSACVIVYSPYDQQPSVWPSPLEAQRVVGRFKSLPEMDQSKKMMNHEEFLRQRMAKVKEQLKRQQRENREYEMTQLINQIFTGQGLQGLGMEDLIDLSRVIEEKTKAIRARIGHLRRAPPQLVTLDEGKKSEEDKMRLGVEMEALQRQTWFMDVMNPPHEQMNCVGDDIVSSSYVDNSSSWCDHFFP